MNNSLYIGIFNILLALYISSLSKNIGSIWYKIFSDVYGVICMFYLIKVII